MKNFVKYLEIVPKIGALNILRVLVYRLRVACRLVPKSASSTFCKNGPFFVTQKSDVLPGNILLFGKYKRCINTVPDWHSDPFDPEVRTSDSSTWYKCFDSPDITDVKNFWELSRFYWIQSYSVAITKGDVSSSDRLEAWVSDWVKKNPPYLGVNWACGQESAIRVVNLAVGTIILGKLGNSQKSLLELVELHVRRIASTLGYALAQDNNHGISEAAALFIGGSWLAQHGNPKGKRWQRQGRKWVENRARRLIEIDGSFSQYSANYHRAVLDTFSMVEVWRRAMNLPPFSNHWYIKTAAATNWLRALLQPNGDVPNLGANDGAWLLQLAATDYRDFRPSVQLASALFCKAKAYSEPGEWNAPLSFLGVELPEEKAPAIGSVQFKEGGYTVMREGACFALLRYPRFRFRPGQADALHLDVWLGSRNILRDGGSFSYNTDEPWLSYFPSVQSHNTVQFDGRDQMPRLSRFLYGEWLKTSRFEPLTQTSAGQTVLAGYRDYQGASHARKLLLSDGKLRVEDEISGFSRNAVLRWRLEPGSWALKGQTLICDGVSIEVVASMPVVRCELVTGWESRYYGQKSELPVLEIEVAEAGRLTTDITWNSL